MNISFLSKNLILEWEKSNFNKFLANLSRSSNVFDN